MEHVERPEARMAWNWAGTDIGKAHHHTVVLNSDGEVLLSRKVVNDEPELLSLISDVLELGEDVVWAVDVADGMACLLVNLLLNHGQTIVYLPGLAVNRAAAGYRGLGKTDAKDARVIADQARMRRDLDLLAPESDLAAELRVMTVKGVMIPIRLLSWAFSVDGEAVGAAWCGTR
ncbi:hypothetical protein SSPO_095530 [Streptomyces antimycoticus]|uniref:Transposase IS110-like N-terminal domain-containing protein n=1 Tax=Streptomyces antimycoticus TaxID=68175 RepID=A0A499UX91_9ACTN|nr:hypothetical protein SSPO_095530 [Streptomyces antimycoticus]